MAERDSTSKGRPGRNRGSTTSCGTTAHDPAAGPEPKSNSALAETIEKERTRLMQAQSLLECIVIAMDYDEGNARGPYYPSVIELARDLVNKSVGQLDSVRLRPMIEQIRSGRDYATAEEKLQAGLSGKDEVKESGQVVYLF